VLLKWVYLIEFEEKGFSLVKPLKKYCSKWRQPKMTPNDPFICEKTNFYPKLDPLPIFTLYSASYRDFVNFSFHISIQLAKEPEYGTSLSGFILIVRYSSRRTSVG